MAAPGIPATEVDSAVLAILERVGRAHHLDEFAHSVCRELHRALGVEWVSYNESNLVTRRTAAVVHPPEHHPSDLDIDHAAGMAHQNPLVRQIEEQPDCGVVTWRQHADERFWRSRLYREVYAPRGITDQCSFGLPGQPGVVTGVALNRADGPFTDADVDFVRRLLPHLANLHSLVVDRERANSIAVSHAEAGWEAALISGDGRVIETSDDAVGIGADCGLDLQQGRSLRTSPVWRSVQDVVARASLRSLTPLRVRHRSGGVEQLVMVNRVGPHLLQLRRRAALAKDVVDGLGLTPRQAEIALLLAEGADNPEIAERLGIAVPTVRKHLESVYRALGVRSRAAVVSALARLER